MPFAALHACARLFGALVPGVLLLAAAVAAAAQAAAPPAELARAAPWALQTPQGQTVRYPEDAGGRPTVLLFWPSWCPYSRALQPYVQDIWRDYRDAGVRVWTINIRETGDPLQAMRERGLSFPLLLDGDALIRPYGISRTPWFVVIDGQGRIVYTRPADAPSPVHVAQAARTALNALLGVDAVPLPERYPPPYDLHLRPAPPARGTADAVPEAEWRAWAAAQLADVDADARVAGVPPQGAISGGKQAIALARALWTAEAGAEAVHAQAPYRAYRAGNLWLVAGRARSGELGQGYLAVLAAEDGAALVLRTR